MILKKLHELYFETNDIYQLESFSDNLIVNDDYQGIMILDFSLNILHKISIMEGLVVNSIYKKYDNTYAIIHDFDKCLIVFVDLQRFNFNIIKLPTDLEGYCFGHNYYWQNNILILNLENHDIFYQFNFQSFSLEKISQKTVKTIAPVFYDFWKACKKYNAITIYPAQNSFVFYKNRKLTAFYDYKNKNLILTKHPSKFFEDIYYHNGDFIFFDLWNKKITFKKNKAFFEMIENYYCLKINFLSNDTIAILQTNKENHQKCVLQIYEWQS
jgi:hypothetical protein